MTRIKMLINEINNLFADKYIDFTMEYYANNNFSFKYYWYMVSISPYITMDYIDRHPKIPWEWNEISRHNWNLTKEYIEQHPDNKWNWEYISMNSFIPVEFIEKHSGESISEEVKKNRIQFDSIDISDKLNIDKYTRDTCWLKQMSIGSDIMQHFIESYPEDSEKFEKNKEIFILQKLREHLAAFKIQQAYLRARYNPAYAYCRKLVHAFYDENFGN